MKIKILLILKFIFILIIFSSCQNQITDIPNKTSKETKSGYINIINSSSTDQITAVFIKITGEDYDYSNDNRLQGSDKIFPNGSRTFPVMANYYYEVEVQINATTSKNKIAGYIFEDFSITLTF